MSLHQIDLRIQYEHKLTNRFTPETFCIAELYHSFLKNYNTNKVKKCNIIVSDNWGEDLGEYTNWSDSKSIKIALDFKNYFSQDKHDKKKIILDKIHKGMIEIAKKEGWQINPLLDAYNSCIEANLVYQFDVGKPKLSPNKKHKIGFWCNWDIDVFEVYRVLYDKKGTEISREKFISKKPNNGEFVYYLKWKWLDNSKVLVEDKYKYGDNEKWTLKIEA
ncbi:hypothetical protein [Tenacibaculum amylolyticum]|uniref:hypothetical protein n=1 Tax=Tenacibaculum amylolyticum TaxID=104269 RepID=UPI0038949106